MKLLTLLYLSSLALPTLSTPTPRDIVFPPTNATIVPTNFSGPGCPGPAGDRRTAVFDYMFAMRDDTPIWTYALNLPSTMGAAIFPDVDKGERYKWCEHEWKFINAEGYRLNVDKNGTWIQARYNLPEGISAVWKVTYYLEGGDQSTDTVRIDGPLDTRNPPYQDLWARSAVPAKKWKTGCGKEKTIKMKTEVTLEGNTTLSATIWGAEPSDVYSRIFQGLTYDWEKC